MLGRTFLASDSRSDAPQSVVLAYPAWQKYLSGDPGIIGRSIFLNEESFVVIGVMPKEFYFPKAEIAAVTLKQLQRQSKARFLVTAGHVHNYEHFFEDGIVYLVSGGGGAKPRPIIRTKGDLYRPSDFPNFNYVKFEVENGLLRATMIRVADPEGSSPVWEARDRFEVASSTKTSALVTGDSSSW